VLEERFVRFTGEVVVDIEGLLAVGWVPRGTYITL
jgi:hypothetical protein